jgi:hypothetical protein
MNAAEIQAIAEDLVTKITFLDQLVFSNDTTHVRPIGFNDKELEDDVTYAGYSTKEDYYIVVARNISRLSTVSQERLFGIAARQVRFRMQIKNPNFVISKEFFIQHSLLRANVVPKITQENPGADEQFISSEIDSFVIEDLVRKICKGLSYEEILENKVDDIKNVIACNEGNFLDCFYKYAK